MMLHHLSLVSTADRPLTAADHRRRLESSALYQQREREYAHAQQLSIVRALWYLSPEFVEVWPDVRSSR